MKLAEDHLDLQTQRGFRRTNEAKLKEKVVVSSEVVERPDLIAKIKTLETDNRTLRERLDANERETKKWKNDKAELLGAGLYGENATTRIVQLSKKNRELTAELESEKSSISRLKRKIKELESAAATKKPNPVEPDQFECDKLRDELKHSQAKLRDLRTMCQQCKRDLKTYQTILSREVGEGINVSELLRKPSSWRGRSQQIQALQQKVQQLQVELKKENSSTRSHVPTPQSAEIKIRDIEMKRKETHQELKRELDQLKAERDERARQCTALKVRNKTLSEDLKTSKTQLAFLIDKTRHDDELIQRLSSSKKVVESSSGIVRDLTRQVEHLKSKLAYQSPRSAPAVARPKSSNPSRCATCLSNDIAVEEQTALRRVAEIERDRLSELVSVLRRDVRDARDQCAETERQLRAERRESATATPRQRRRRNSDADHLDNLEVRLESVLLENAALRRARHDADDLRDHDLKVYGDLARETREVFLGAIKRMKASAESN